MTNLEAAYMAGHGGVNSDGSQHALEAAYMAGHERRRVQRW